ncbi:hypothetical protein [Methylobacterium sp. D54C]
MNAATTVPAPPPPRIDHPENKLWVDEQIWGHRLWDSQSPWLILMEFLVVAEAQHRSGALLAGGSPYPLRYRPNKRMYLRNILYNNESLVRVAERVTDDATAWARWLEWMGENAQAVPSRDFSYLRSRFPSFHEFAALVGMLRSSTVESKSNKRWSSRFVFPFGPSALYEDLNVSAGTASREYIYFGLPGELLYQMLARSDRAGALAAHFAQAFEGSDPADRLLARMQPDVPDDVQVRGNSYLPYERHPCFDALGADWTAVLDQRLPRFDAYPHLATLGALHILLYQLRVAADVLGEGRPALVCEMVAPRKTLVRELSVASYARNDGLSARAVERYVAAIGEGEDWRRFAAEPEGFANCRGLVQERVRWPRGPDDYGGPAEPDRLLAELRRSALARHRQHVGQVHRSYGAGIGLVSRRGTNRFRYAPTDALLKALILANVEVRMEFSAFLILLHERYGLVFGDREAAASLDAGDVDFKAFQANAERLERRLKALGLLRRLSDACAYVENPFRRAAR